MKGIPKWMPFSTYLGASAKPSCSRPRGGLVIHPAFVRHNVMKAPPSGLQYCTRPGIPQWMPASAWGIDLVELLPAAGRTVLTCPTPGGPKANRAKAQA
jgi:hypothetical protein